MKVLRCLKKLFLIRKDGLSSEKSLWQLLYSHELTYSSYVRTRVVILKTCRRRWMIGRNGERRSGISAQAARHDDDDDSLKGCLKYNFFVDLNFFIEFRTYLNCINKRWNISLVSLKLPILTVNRNYVMFTRLFDLFLLSEDLPFLSKSISFQLHLIFLLFYFWCDITFVWRVFFIIGGGVLVSLFVAEDVEYISASVECYFIVCLFFFLLMVCQPP